VIVDNTPTMAALPNWRAAVVVYPPCGVGTAGPVPLPVSGLEPRFHGLTSAVKSYELLTIEAAIDGDEEAAMLALLANPLGPDAAHVEAVWNDIKKTNEGMLPRFTA
jgi:6-phospho-beta-glucosidase